MFIIKRNQRLESLTKEEKKILRLYTTSETRTQYFSPHDGTVAELAALDILVVYNSRYNTMQGIPYGIADWALKYLRSNHHLLRKK